MAKYKTTGCFKFLIFLILAVPVAFVISSYYHGEDPLNYVKEKLGSQNQTNKTGSNDTDDCEMEINELRNKIRELNLENGNLSKLLKEKDKVIDGLNEGR